MGAFSIQRKVATNEIHQNIVFSATARASHWPLALHLLDTLEADVIGVSSAMEAFGCASRWQMAVELHFALNGKYGAPFGTKGNFMKTFSVVQLCCNKAQAGKEGHLKFRTRFSVP